VYIDKENGLVRFVQVTEAESHTFLIQYFHALLNVLKEYMETITLEIYFLCPKAVKTTISRLEGEGLL
jgi:hypothetical protein